MKSLHVRIFGNKLGDRIKFYSCMFVVELRLNQNQNQNRQRQK